MSVKGSINAKTWCRGGRHQSQDGETCASCSCCWRHCDCMKVCPLCGSFTHDGSEPCPGDDLDPEPDPSSGGATVAIRCFPVTEESGELHVLRLARAKELSAEGAATSEAWAKTKAALRPVRESALDRFQRVAREGSEAREARRTESEDEKHARWAAERDQRAGEQWRSWRWVADNGRWIVHTGSLECERVQGYVVIPESFSGKHGEIREPATCSCPDFAKRGDQVTCKHVRGLRAKLMATMDAAYKKAA